MKKKYCFLLTLILVLTLPVLIFSFVGLVESIKMKNYYSEKGNYINASGTITDLEYAEDGDLLILRFGEDITPVNTFTSRKFLIEGRNLLAIKDAGFDEKVKVGGSVEFTTVPAVLYGYARPIVSLTVNGEVLLEFEDGYTNLLEEL